MTVHYTREGPVAWLTIDRPEARNALSAAVRAGLWHGVRRFVADDAAVLVLTGAGGFLLAQQCDLVVAAEHAAFAVTEVRVGRGAPWAAPLPWLVGPRAAAEILLTGEPVGAARAYEIGLVNRVVPAAELHERTQALAERIAANAPLSVSAAKRTVYLSAPAAEADEIWAPVYRSADAQEGPRAFREKRTPVWKGR